MKQISFNKKMDKKSWVIKVSECQVISSKSKEKEEKQTQKEKKKKEKKLKKQQNFKLAWIKFLISNISFVG